MIKHTLEYGFQRVLLEAKTTPQSPWLETVLVGKENGFFTLPQFIGVVDQRKCCSVKGPI
ncbi:hypothetical protein L195_g062776, partial [Trifolium pratense]